MKKTCDPEPMILTILRGRGSSPREHERVVRHYRARAGFSPLARAGARISDPYIVVTAAQPQAAHLQVGGVR